VTEPQILADGLHKSFAAPARGEPPVVVLDGISLAVSQGEMVSIVGPSGSGKSTLLHCLSGLERADSGTVRLLGRTVAGMGRGALASFRRRHVGFVFQSYNLIPSLTARDNVALPARLARGRVDRTAVDAALAAVGLADRSGHRPSHLSGGQQQRVAIARVLAMRPDLVFADEPTGALDTVTGTLVLDLLRASTDGGRSVVLVTHDLEAAARADRVLVLRDGRIHRELHAPRPQDVFAAVTAAGADGAASGETRARVERSGA